MPGRNSRSMTAFSCSSSRFCQKPTARPARYAAPNAVTSRTSGRSTRVPRISDWNCIRKLLATAPPSTRRACRRIPESACIASRTSRVWYAIDSSVARMMWLEFTPRVRPKMAPRAYGSQYGAPRPVNAGTTYTPLVSFTLVAKYSESNASLMSFISSRSHWIDAPAINTAPSSA